MTYGWAILIIVIIGGALYALGVFNPATWTSSKRATGFASLQVKDWKLTNTGATGAQLVIGNKYGAGINIQGFSFNTTGTVAECTYGLASGAGTALAENQETTLTSTTCNATSFARGKSYTANVEIYFVSSGVNHIDSGTITGKIE